MAEVTRFLERVRGSRDADRVYQVHLATLHAVDHLLRLIASLREGHSADLLAGQPALCELGRRLTGASTPLRSWLGGQATQSAAALAGEISLHIAEQRRTLRPLILERTAAGDLTPSAALEQLEALQWIDRVSYHIWRAMHHLDRADATTRGKSTAPPETEPPSP